MRSDEDFVKEFKSSYEREFGETITDKEASEKFFGLVNLLKTIIHGASDQDPADTSKKFGLIDASESSVNIID